MRIKFDGQLWNVWLSDDGTLDTIISVCPVRGRHRVAHEIRFDGEYASNARRKDGAMTTSGFRRLALEAIAAYADDLEDS